MCSSACSVERSTVCAAVGHPGLGHQLLGVDLRPLEPGGRGARPEARRSRALERVDEPGDQRRLGADDDQVDPLAAAASTIPSTSSPPTSTHRASAAIPALPGAQSSSGRAGSERARARSRARAPPPPTTRTLIASS